MPGGKGPRISGLLGGRGPYGGGPLEQIEIKTLVCQTNDLRDAHLMCPGPILRWLPGPQPPGPGIPEVGDPVEQRKSKNQGFIFQMQTRSRRWGQSWSKLNVGSKSRRSSRSCHLACDHQRSESWDVVLNEQATSLKCDYTFILPSGMQSPEVWNSRYLENKQWAQFNFMNGFWWSTKWFHPSKYLGSRVPCWQDFKKKYLKVALFVLLIHSQNFPRGYVCKCLA